MMTSRSTVRSSIKTWQKRSSVAFVLFYSIPNHWQSLCPKMKSIYTSGTSLDLLRMPLSVRGSVDQITSWTEGVKILTRIREDGLAKDNHSSYVMCVDLNQEEWSQSIRPQITQIDMPPFGAYETLIDCDLGVLFLCGYDPFRTALGCLAYRPLLPHLSSPFRIATRVRINPP